ncbi:hypothetical protein [Modestobacter sp. KNN46-3]|nr:hypothetical protein [Modestobacter sp. KNN46-3]
MVRSLVVAVLVAGGVAVPAGVAQAHPGSGGQSQGPGMAQMHELMEQGNPGMARMHELMQAENPGMAQMCERMHADAD